MSASRTLDMHVSPLLDIDWNHSNRVARETSGVFDNKKLQIWILVYVATFQKKRKEYSILSYALKVLRFIKFLYACHKNLYKTFV